MFKRDIAKKLKPVEVLVVVIVCFFAVAIIGSAAQMSRFDAYRIECATNLSNIGRAMLIYANDYEDELPRAGGESTDWAPTIPDWKADDRFRAYVLSVDGSGGMASISSCFYLLVKYAEVTPETFICPGDVDTTEFKLADVDSGGKELIDLWDFGPEAREHCSYAYHMPFSWYALTTSSDPGLAVAADRNPWTNSPGAFAKQYPGIFLPDGGRDSVKYGNAIAHEEEGQNVLFLDGHVAFEDCSFCGISDDNIYTYWDGGDPRIGSPPTIGSMSSARDDSLLVHDPVMPTGTVIIKDPTAIESTDLVQTSFVVTLDCTLPKNQNVIWCSAFQMAWDKLKEDIIGEPVEVIGAEELADLLNSAEFSDKDIEGESYFAAAGLLGEEIIEEIQEQMAQLFPSGPAPVFDDMNGLPPETIIAYSYLNTDIEFEYPFYINNVKFDFQNSNGTISQVKSFCTRMDADSVDLASRQVKVLYYKQYGQIRETEFIVDLCRYTYPYQVVLACVPQQETLGMTLAFVEQKISEFEQNPDGQRPYLRPAYSFYPGAQRPADTLIVPDVLYKLTHHFQELEGRVIGNLPWLDQRYFIYNAMQVIDFSLGRTGVFFNSEVQIIVPSPGWLHQPRNFYFNRPFLIYIKKRGPDYSPFFVIWVDNAELMQEFVFEGQ